MELDACSSFSSCAGRIQITGEYDDEKSRWKIGVEKMEGSREE